VNATGIFSAVEINAGVNNANSNALTCRTCLVSIQGVNARQSIATPIF
jgi:hypothetical protein